MKSKLGLTLLIVATLLLGASFIINVIYPMITFRRIEKETSDDRALIIKHMLSRKPSRESQDDVRVYSESFLIATPSKTADGKEEVEYKMYKTYLCVKGYPGVVLRMKVVVDTLPKNYGSSPIDWLRDGIAGKPWNVISERQFTDIDASGIAQECVMFSRKDGEPFTQEEKDWATAYGVEEIKSVLPIFFVGELINHNYPYEVALLQIAREIRVREAPPKKNPK